MAVEIKNLTVYPRHRQFGYTVILEVTGPTHEVQRWIDDYLCEYPAAGYGTWVASRDQLPEGRLRVTVRRNDSCD